MSLFYEECIPVGKIFFRCLSLSDFFQEGIALPEDSFIFSADFSKLSEGTFEDIVEHISANTGRKIEEIHIEGRDKDCPVGKLIIVLHSGKCRALDFVDVLHLSPDPCEALGTDTIRKNELEF